MAGRMIVRTKWRKGTVRRTIALWFQFCNAWDVCHFKCRYKKSIFVTTVIFIHGYIQKRGGCIAKKSYPSRKKCSMSVRDHWKLSDSSGISSINLSKTRMRLFMLNMRISVRPLLNEAVAVISIAMLKNWKQKNCQNDMRKVYFALYQNNRGIVNGREKSG